MKFSETPCEAGKTYEGPATHTREVLHRLGYEAAEIDRLAVEGVMGMTAMVPEAITY